jgi:hypothetical protein
LREIAPIAISANSNLYCLCAELRGYFTEKPNVYTVNYTAGKPKHNDTQQRKAQRQQEQENKVNKQ